jgi:4-amino-4-deoxy-L-arabinose transferase-like glycosyltransferase
MTFEGKTETAAPARMPASRAEHAAIALILLFAAGMRLWHIDFGLPALNDPDEPVFIMTALDMLREGRLNPGWFGHPATLLFYLLALVIVGVAGIGRAVGHWASTDAFVAAVFADPATIVLPMRVMIAGFGVASVAMTWRIGRRIAGPVVGLIAALLLSINALHVELSQVIRTDMLVTLLMGWCLLHALAIVGSGRPRDHVLAGVAAGLACATKWPALLVLVAPVLAGTANWDRTREGEAGATRSPLCRALVAPAVATLTLVLVSPYLALDWRTVLQDLHGEARPIHLGATGFGLLGNLWWYIRHPFYETFGAAGLVLTAIGGGALAALPGWRMVVLPAFALLLLALSAQSLVWARWIAPLLPLTALMAAMGLRRLTVLMPMGKARNVAGVVVLAIVISSMAQSTLSQQTMRAHDPRQAAAAWILRHVPASRTILVEHAAFDLLTYRGRLLFPLGSAGCVDVRAALAGAPSHRRINKLRERRAIVDIGHIEPLALRGCRADVIVLSNLARYRREPVAFASQLANYRGLTAGYARRMTFRGAAGGDRALEVEIFTSAGGAP